MNGEDTPEIKKRKLQHDQKSNQLDALQIKGISVDTDFKSLDITQPEQMSERKVEDWLASTDPGVLMEDDNKSINAKVEKISPNGGCSKDVCCKQDTEPQAVSEKSDVSQPSSMSYASEDGHAESFKEVCSKQNSESQPKSVKSDISQPSSVSYASEDELNDTDVASSDESLTNESSDGESLSLLVALQKRRLALAQAKLDFEEKLFNKEMEIRNKKLELEMKRIEMEHKWKEKERELKIKELEMREKIAQYELEKIADKINNN